MADALEAKIAELVAAQDRERRFTANVAHELRTPLAALVAEASVLSEQGQPPELPLTGRAADRRRTQAQDAGRRTDGDLHTRCGAGLVQRRVVDVGFDRDRTDRGAGWQARVAVSGGALMRWRPTRAGWERIPPT
jgi:two-component system sensor histidine kinase MtrB